jgi:hypothetical protein
MTLTSASDNRSRLLYQHATSREQFHATIEITVSEKIYYYQSTKKFRDDLDGYEPTHPAERDPRVGTKQRHPIT